MAFSEKVLKPPLSASFEEKQGRLKMADDNARFVGKWRKDYAGNAAKKSAAS